MINQLLQKTWKNWKIILFFEINVNSNELDDANFGSFTLIDSRNKHLQRLNPYLQQQLEKCKHTSYSI